MHIKLVGVDGTLHHRFAQAITRSDEHNLFKTSFGIDGEHDTCRTQVRPDHALHARRQGNFCVRKTFVNAVTDGSVVVQGGKNFFHLVQHIFNAHHIQECFLLPCKRCIGQIFGCGRRANCKRGLQVASTENGKLVTDGFFKVCRKRLGLDHLANFCTHHRQGANVFNIQSIQLLIDAIDQAVVL